jgi:hypothetical protein
VTGEAAPPAALSGFAYGTLRPSQEAEAGRST